MGFFGKKKSKLTLEDAQALLARRQYDKATEVLRKLLKRNPKDDKIRLRLADALAMQGRKEQALFLYTELAEYYARSGFIHKAIAVNKMILKLDPHMTDFQQRLEELFQHQQISFAQKISQLEMEEASEERQKITQQVPPEEPKEINQEAEEISQEAEEISQETEEISQASPLEEPEEKFQEASFGESNDIFLKTPLDIPVEEFREPFQEPPIEEPQEIPIEEPEEIPQEEPEALSPTKTPLFSDFTKEEFAEVAKMMNLRDYFPGDIIIKEGEPGSSLFIIIDGEVEVITKDKDGQSVPLARLKDGDFFGEVSLLTGRPRTATILAVGYVRMMELDKESLDAITGKFPRVQKVLEDFYQKRVHQTIEAMLKSFKETQQ